MLFPRGVTRGRAEIGQCLRRRSDAAFGLGVPGCAASGFGHAARRASCQRGNGRPFSGFLALAAPASGNAAGGKGQAGRPWGARCVKRSLGRIARPFPCYRSHPPSLRHLAPSQSPPRAWLAGVTSTYAAQSLRGGHGNAIQRCRLDRWRRADLMKFSLL